MLDLKVGQRGEPFDMPIESGKLWEFALATGAGDPPVNADHPPAAPPTFLVTSALWYRPGSWVLESAVQDWSRLLSGGSEFPFHDVPLQAGERLTARQRVESRLFGADHIRRFAVQFREQVWPGDVISYQGEVVARRPVPSGWHELEVELVALRHGGGPAVLAEATVAVNGAAGEECRG